MRTFPPMHLHVPLSIAQQEIEAYKQYSNHVVCKYTEAMARSVDAYKYEMEHVVELHVQETSALLAMALEVNTNLQAIIAQQQKDNAHLQTENAKKITQLEDQLAAEQMHSFRRYMSDNHNNKAETATLDLWDENDASNANTCSLQSIYDFMHLTTFEEAPYHTNPT